MPIPEPVQDRHAFVLLGDRVLFACHLPMFHMEAHRYELVLQVRLADQALRDWRADRAQHPKATYFLANAASDEWSIPQLQVGHRTKFDGEIYRDIPRAKRYEHWPWGVSKGIAQGGVFVERIVHCRHFSANMPHPETETYLVFGNGDEAHLYHHQTRQPDFDETLTLTAAPPALPKILLEAGVHIAFPNLKVDPQGQPVCSSRLREKEKYRVRYFGIAPGPDPTEFEIEIGRCLWFSTKILNFQDPCAQPSVAGAPAVAPEPPSAYRTWWKT